MTAGIVLTIDAREVWRRISALPDPDQAVEGEVLADLVAELADRIRERVVIVPAPGGEWIAERHELLPGAAVLTLTAIERTSR